MASFISVPLKKTYEVDLIKPLKKFIKNTFTQANPDDYNTALNEFNKLRGSVISKFVDKHESALEILYRYYDQLSAIDGKLPIAENQIRVQFKWRDALSGKKNLAIASASYEKVCILFNIAALQSQVAANQSQDNNEGLKLTVKLFQQSSGIYGYLKDIVLSHVRQDPTSDLNPDTLSALKAIMLAQAQESIFRKATQDNMKEGMIAKLALQTSELYSDAAKLMQLASVKELWPKDWLSIVVMKQSVYHGMAEFYQSCVSKQAKSYGEEIARLQHAKELLVASQTKGSAFSFRQELTRVERALENAKKDNNFIFHDTVPELKMLQPIGKAVVAKSTPMSQQMSAKFTDLFEKIVPLAVHEALTHFENRKSQVVNMEVGRLRSATDQLNSVLSSLNLPAALEDLSGERVPQSLLDKAQQLKEMGGLTKVDKLMNDLPGLLTRNREILNESIRVLDDEAKSDQQLKEQFKERWARTSSASLSSPMRDEAGKYTTILDTAVIADRMVREKFNTHKNAISILSKTKAELESSLPAAVAAASLQKSVVVAKLRRLIEQVNTIKAERDVIESEIKDAKFDMSSKFFASLTLDGVINEETISEVELTGVFTPLKEQVTESLHRQETLLSQIQNTNTEFCNAKTSGQSVEQRDKLLKDLASGFDSFMELKCNLEEGTRFYNDLTPLLVRLQSKINDFCFARKTEKEELLTDLQKTIANTPSQPPPLPPRYQGGTGQPTSQAQSNASAAVTTAPKPATTAPKLPTTAPKPTNTASKPPAAGPKPAPRAPPPPPTSAAPSTTPPTTEAPSASVPVEGHPTASAPPEPTPSPPQPGQTTNLFAQAGIIPNTTWPPPYTAYPGHGYPPVLMPGSFNPYNPFMAYAYPGQQIPYPLPGQYPPYVPQEQPYSQQQQPPPQTGYTYPGYPPQH